MVALCDSNTTRNAGLAFLLCSWFAVCTWSRIHPEGHKGCDGIVGELNRECSVFFQFIAPQWISVTEWRTACSLKPFELQSVLHQVNYFQLHEDGLVVSLKHCADIGWTCVETECECWTNIGSFIQSRNAQKELAGELGERTLWRPFTIRWILFNLDKTK